MRTRAYRAGGRIITATLGFLLLAGCEEGEMGDLVKGGSFTTYSDPEGRFSFVAPEGLTVESLVGGRILQFRSDAGEVLLEAEIGTPEPAALEQVPIEQHGGDLWLAHLIWRIQAWCAADGPTGTQYCIDQASVEEVPGSGGAIRAVEVVPLRTLEDFTTGTSETLPIGPIWGVALAEDPAAFLLMITPANREPATEEQRDYAEAILRALDRGWE